MYIHITARAEVNTSACSDASDTFRKGDTIGNPHRAQISQFEFFEFILFLKVDQQFPVERFEATVSQSRVPSPPLNIRSLTFP